MVKFTNCWRMLFSNEILDCFSGMNPSLSHTALYSGVFLHFILKVTGLMPWLNYAQDFAQHFARFFIYAIYLFRPDAVFFIAYCFAVVLICPVACCLYCWRMVCSCLMWWPHWPSSTSVYIFSRLLKGPQRRSSDWARVKNAPSIAFPNTPSAC